MSEIKAAAKRLLKIVYPNRCRICGEVIELDAGICAECSRVDKKALPRCYSCGCSKDDCTCKKNKNEFKRIVAPYYYDGQIKKGVSNFKRGGMPFLAESMAQDISVCIEKEYDDIELDYITFVPMTRGERTKRGYNQSELIARELSKLIHVECVPLLIKEEKTRPQKEMSSKERLVNLFGVFEVKNIELIQNSSILLVDDIKTTGSTLSECAKMLNLYGAKEVYSAVYAVVKKEKK